MTQRITRKNRDRRGGHQSRSKIRRIDSWWFVSFYEIRLQKKKHNRLARHRNHAVEREEVLDHLEELRITQIEEEIEILDDWGDACDDHWLEPEPLELVDYGDDDGCPAYYYEDMY